MDKLLILLVFVIAVYLLTQQESKPRVILGGAWGRSRKPPVGGCGCW